MSGSMRESLRALNTTFVATSVPPALPEELLAIIQPFLDRYDDIDDYDAQRFHEELHALYLRHVAGQPDKLGAFLSTLRLLRPVITGDTRLTTWWDLVLKPIIDGVGHKRHEIEEAREFVLSILVYDRDTDPDGQHARVSVLFTNKLLDAYLTRTNSFGPIGITLSPDNEFASHELESLLVIFGRRMPKALLFALDKLFVQKQHRIQALTLLSEFVRLQPPHLHLVLETQLIQNLEKCLLIDTCATVIDLALVVLIMFLPHICAALTSDHHLQKMFLIYCRILCWDRLGSVENSEVANQFAESDDDQDDEVDYDDSEPAWEKVQQSAEYQDSSPQTLIHYFTFLYGLFPLNFTSFIRKPRKYLKSLNFPGARDFDLDQDLVHRRTERYHKFHLLHPNMFMMTVEDELSENRWAKSDPADVVMECMDLCVGVPLTEHPSEPPPVAALPLVPGSSASLDLDGECSASDAIDNTEALEMSLKSKSIKSVRSEVSMASPLLKGRDMMESPIISPTKENKNHDVLIAHMATTQRSLTQQPGPDHFVENVTETNPSITEDSQSIIIASLQREIMLLRNDLSFERYLKLQHQGHIGQLQRKHIKEATAESETQNLINSNKTLKARLAKANELYAQLKKETFTSRSQSKKWETDLSAKVRTYKDSEKSWQINEGSLRFELQRIQTDYNQLKQIVERAEAQQIKAQQRAKALEYEVENYNKTRRELEAAQDKVLAYEDQARELHTLMQERIDLRNDLEIANMRLNGWEQEREISIKAYERRMMELERRLQMSERNTGRPGQLPSSVQAMLDSTLAASNAKIQHLKKTHCHLLEKYTELQMRFHDLEGQYHAELGQAYSQKKSKCIKNEGASPDTDIEKERDRYSYQHSSDMMKNPGSAAPPIPSGSESQLDAQRPQRAQTAPLPYPGFGGAVYPEANPGYDASLKRFRSQQSCSIPQSSGSGSLSIDTDGSGGRDKKDKADTKSEVRYYGRGGAQNNSKWREKEKDKDSKKPSSSKSGGFRGLKGII